MKLIQAILEKQPLDSLRRLIDGGEDINQIDTHNHSALELAIDELYDDAANLLIERSATPRTRTLFYAAKRAHIGALNYCLERSLNVNDRQFDGFTPLTAAIAEAHEYLNIADPEAKDSMRYSRFPQIVQLLLKAGANPNIATDSGQTALHAAAAFGEHNLSQLLFDGCLEQHKHLNLNAQDAYGLTALHLAARAGNVRVATQLLDWGADPNVGEKYGFTPLHEAVENNHIELVRLLLARGADRKMATELDCKPFLAGTTPLDIAKMRGYEDYIYLLD